MYLRRVAATLFAVVLAQSGPLRAQTCEPSGPVQTGGLSRLTVPDHAMTAFASGSLATGAAAAAERKPQSLAEIETRWREVEAYLSTLNSQATDDFLRKLAPGVAKLQPRSESEFEYIHALQFMGLKGWALEWHGVLYATEDGGLTWSARRVPVPQTGTAAQDRRSTDRRATDDEALRGLQFLTPRVGYALGHRGVIATTDAGASWVQLGNPSRNPLLALSCVADSGCWVGGYEPSALFRRPSGSAVWDSQATPASGGILAIQFIDARTGFAVGDGGEIIGTSDGGAHWTLLHKDRKTRLWSVFFLDARRGWAAGENGVLLRTEDGGRTWSEGDLGIPSSLPRFQLRLHAVRFLDADTGWAAGINGVILGTTDGGRCWRLAWYEGAAPYLSIYALAVSDGPVVWAAGNSGNLIASRDKGQFWFPVKGLVREIAKEFERLVPTRDPSSR